MSLNPYSTPEISPNIDLLINFQYTHPMQTQFKLDIVK